MKTDSEIKEQIAKDYGKEFWYYSCEETKALIEVYRQKEENR
jgi:hypothetical protein